MHPSIENAAANDREYKRESTACFCLLAIVIFILMMIFNKDLCNSENGRFGDRILSFDFLLKILESRFFCSV